MEELWRVTIGMCMTKPHALSMIRRSSNPVHPVLLAHSCLALLLWWEDGEDEWNNTLPASTYAHEV